MKDKVKNKKSWWTWLAGSEIKGRPDYILALLVFALVVFGLIMISSASVVMSYDTYGDSHRILMNQVQSALMGLVAFFIAAKINYLTWKKHALLMLFITLALLIMVFVPGLKFEYGGASRWVLIGPLFFQPSELIKLTYLFYLATWLAKKKDQLQDFSSGFVPFLVLLLVITGLIMLQPDLGTMLVIALMSSVLFFVAGANIKHIAIAGAAGVMAIYGLILAAPYRMARLKAFLNPEENMLGIGYHIQQALVAIGSGGWFGRGFGRSMQKYSYLPEVTGDSIFAVISEELGFLRMVLFIAVYVLLILRGFKIARNAPDTFGRLLALGITCWIGFQAFVNMSAMLALVPLTGLPLPFISYGGSSLIICLVAMGVLYNISKASNKNN